MAYVPLFCLLPQTVNKLTDLIIIITLKLVRGSGAVIIWYARQNEKRPLKYGESTKAGRKPNRKSIDAAKSIVT
jgi:hypothetical protein